MNRSRKTFFANFLIALLATSQLNSSKLASEFHSDDSPAKDDRRLVFLSPSKAFNQHNSVVRSLVDGPNGNILVEFDSCNCNDATLDAAKLDQTVILERLSLFVGFWVTKLYKERLNYNFGQFALEYIQFRSEVKDGLFYFKIFLSREDNAMNHPSRMMLKISIDQKKIEVKITIDKDKGFKEVYPGIDGEKNFINISVTSEGFSDKSICMASGIIVKKVLANEIERFSDGFRKVEWCSGNKFEEEQPETMEGDYSPRNTKLNDSKDFKEYKNSLENITFPKDIPVSENLRNYLQSDKNLFKENSGLFLLSRRHLNWQPFIVRFLNVALTDKPEGYTALEINEVSIENLEKIINNDFCIFDEPLMCRMHYYLKRIPRLVVSSLVKPDGSTKLRLTFSNLQRIEATFLKTENTNGKFQTSCIEIEVFLSIRMLSNYYCIKKAKQQLETGSQESKILLGEIFRQLFQNVLVVESDIFSLISQFDILNFVSVFTEKYKKEVKSDIQAEEILTGMALRNLEGFDVIQNENTVLFNYSYKENFGKIRGELISNADGFYSLSLECSSQIIELQIQRHPPSELMPFTDENVLMMNAIEVFDIRDKNKVNYLLTKLSNSIKEFYMVLEEKPKVTVFTDYLPEQVSTFSAVVGLFEATILSKNADKGMNSNPNEKEYYLTFSSTGPKSTETASGPYNGDIFTQKSYYEYEESETPSIKNEPSMDLIKPTIDAIARFNNYSPNGDSNSSSSNLVRMDYGIPELKKKITVSLFEHSLGIFDIYHVVFHCYYFSHEFIVPMGTLADTKDLFDALIDKMKSHYKEILLAIEHDQKGSDFDSVDKVLAMLSKVINSKELAGEAVDAKSFCIFNKEDDKFEKYQFYLKFAEASSPARKLNTDSEAKNYNIGNPKLRSKPNFLLEREKSVNQIFQNLNQNTSLLGQGVQQKKSRKLLTFSRRLEDRLPEPCPNEPKLTANLFLSKDTDRINPWILSFSDRIKLKGRKSMPLNASMRFSTKYTYDYQRVIKNFFVLLKDNLANKENALRAAI
jgi:hypothetical protein